MKRALIAMGLVVPLAVGCHDQPSVTAVRRGLSANLLDGSISTGNPHFFFLPPLVPQPTFTGVFNPQIQPVVDICQLDLTVAVAACALGVAHINPGVPQIDAPEQYHVDWHTDLFALDLTKFYRIQVFGSAGGLLLGFVDVAPVLNGGQLRNVNTGAFIGLVDGRTLPIRFRIEKGAFLPDFNCTDCAEQTVTNAGATVVTNTDFAGAQFPAGWLTSPSSVVVTIERLSVNDQVLSSSCIPTLPVAQQQFQGCYQFKTSPRATFATNVTVGICANVAQPLRDVITLFTVDTIDGVLTTRALPNIPAPFVSCGGFASALPPGASFRDLAGYLLHRVESFFVPTPAFAYHVGSGGATCCFSRIGWAAPLGRLINPDADATGASLLKGTVINSTYASLGVTFSRTLSASVPCPGSNVYANDHGPLETGGFGFATGDNHITVCPEGTASDFSETSFGRIVATFSPTTTFSGTATQVCIHAYVTGPSGAQAVLQAFNTTTGGLPIAQALSQPNAFGENLCVNAAGIARVEFAGFGVGFAIFDNLVFVPTTIG